MRFTTTLLLLTSLAVVPAGAFAGTRSTRCCLELAIPDVPPGPICVELRARRRLGSRRACRLLGGRPIGRGDCSLAACRPA